MLIYKIQNCAQQPCIILHFGIGLVGAAIQRTMFFLSPPTHIEEVFFPWDLAPAQKQLDLILNKTNSLIQTADIPIYIIWSAGKCGFSATTTETEQEEIFFNAISNLLNDYAAQLANPVFFYLSSSAGGLFEGQSFINSHSKPAPKRPYGFLKLTQEQHLLNKTALKAKIFRISSVYSKYLPQTRMGLIAVMMNNCIKHKITTIFGASNTLRDYILDEDIGQYIAQSIWTGIELSQISFLISGQPSSILSIQQQIERISNKRSYINFTISKSNASNICFSQKLVPDGLYPSPLYSNLKLLYLNILGNRKI